MTRHAGRITTLVRSTPRSDDRLVAGVCGGLGRRLRIDPIVVRVAFVVLAVAGGVGIPLYIALWFVLPAADGSRGIQLDSTQVGDLRRPLAIGLIVAGTLLLIRNFGFGFSDRLVWPLTLAGFGAAVLWMRSDADDRAKLRSAAARLPGRPLEVLGGRYSLMRMVVGGVLVLGGVGAFLAVNDGFAVARQVTLAVTVIIAGLALILGPWIRRLLEDLAAERRRRIRSEERADMAAHLHDSVLQTLALIQRNADRPRELVALARRQERELRAWLYEDRPWTNGATPATIASAMSAMTEEVEARHGVDVDLVTVGDCELDEHGDALVAAAREAAVNAAKHAGVDAVSVFVEVEPECVSAFVRDRGKGFDVGAVPDDRRGIEVSIRQRMARHGGKAAVTSTPGEGTEVALELPRER